MPPALHGITAVIPVLDDAERLARLLKALEHWEGLEIVVVDGGSYDDPQAVCRRFGARCLASARGRGGQLRLGAAAARGDWLWFLHADAEVTPELATPLVEAVGNAGWGRFDVRLSGTSPMLRVVAFLMNWRSRLTGICTGDQGIFVSRELLEAVGGVPDQPLMEDIELSRRLRRHARPRRVAARLGSSGRRWEEAGVWRTVFSMWWLRLRYFFGARPEDLYRRYYGDRLSTAPDPVAPPRMAVFARSPERGLVKTRLASTLGADGALEVHVALAETTLAAVAEGSFDAELWFAGTRNDLLAAWSERYGLPLVEQPEGDLGERMLAALLAGARAVVGTDIPAMTAGYIEDALRRLRDVDVVLGPVADGGYCLIGMNAPHPALFHGIEWGGSDVLRRTLARAADAGLRVAVLDTLWDVDDEEDHARWRAWVAGRV